MKIQGWDHGFIPQTMNPLRPCLVLDSGRSKERKIKIFFKKKKLS